MTEGGPVVTSPSGSGTAGAGAACAGAAGAGAACAGAAGAGAAGAGAAGAGAAGSGTAGRRERLTVSALGEDGLVGSVIARYAPAPVGVLVGPGDDAAVLDVPGRTVVSTDTLVEGYDFRQDWSTAHDVGVKTAAQNLADIAAMGATPIALVVSLATPGDLPSEWAVDLSDGLAAECARCGAAVVGGDVSQAGEIVITGTAVGALSGPAVLRGGARPGEVVALAGITGHSAAGLALLQAGLDVTADPVLSALVRAHLAPQPQYGAGPVAARSGATAMIDTSDGLVRDARRVAEASAVVVDLDPQALLPGEELLAAASALGEERAAVGWVLSGGEDHALLACFPAGTVVPEPFRVIGVVRAADPPQEEGKLDPPQGEGTLATGRQGRGAQRPGVLLGGHPYAGGEGWLHFT
jgi:thiamine-monophosphate kinase